MTTTELLWKALGKDFKVLLSLKINSFIFNDFHTSYGNFLSRF